MTEAQQDVLDAWRSEHRGIERAWRLASQADDAVADSSVADPADEQESELDREQLVAMLVRHFVGEEEYLWPLVRRVLPDGDTIADDGFAQNRTCENALRLLEDQSLLPEQLDAAMDEVRRIATDHIATQERTVFPALTERAEPAELLRLTDEVLGAEQVAPSRPRHVAAESAAVSKVETVVAGFVDHLRDQFSRRGRAGQ